MKRLCTSDSPLGGLMSICPTSSADEEIQGSNHVYSMEFQTMLEGLVDEEGCVEESGHNVGGKKRRLSVDQVKALERNFEVENKLEPERKVKLAQELGLQPRQVAVWFQNRRARWKTKQLERDYGILKANFDALKHNFDNLQHDNQALHKEIYELKSKLQDDKGGDIKVSVLKEEEEEEALMVPPIVLCNNNNNNNDKVLLMNQQLADKAKSPPLDDDDDDMLITEFDDEDEVVRRELINFEIFNSNKNGLIIGGAAAAASIFKDVVGSSDSDSSAILNEENNNNNNNNNSCSPNASNGRGGEGINLGFQFSDTKGGGAILGDAHKSYLSQFVKIEEHNFFSGGDHDESCTTFFSDEQPPTLHWDCPDQPWN